MALYKVGLTDQFSFSDSSNYVYITSYKNVCSNLSPTSYWRLDETSGLTVFDIEGNNNLIYGADIVLNQTGLIVGNDAAIYSPGTLNAGNAESIYASGFPTTLRA